MTDFPLEGDGEFNGPSGPCELCNVWQQCCMRSRSGDCCGEPEPAYECSGACLAIPPQSPETEDFSPGITSTFILET